MTFLVTKLNMMRAHNHTLVEVAFMYQNDSHKNLFQLFFVTRYLLWVMQQC